MLEAVQTVLPSPSLASADVPVPVELALVGWFSASVLLVAGGVVEPV